MLSGCDTHGSNGSREVVVGPFLLRLLAHELSCNVDIAITFVFMIYDAGLDAVISVDVPGDGVDALGFKQDFMIQHGLFINPFGTLTLPARCCDIHSALWISHNKLHDASDGRKRVSLPPSMRPTSRRPPRQGGQLGFIQPPPLFFRTGPHHDVFFPGLECSPGRSGSFPANFSLRLDPGQRTNCWMWKRPPASVTVSFPTTLRTRF